MLKSVGIFTVVKNGREPYSPGGWAIASANVNGTIYYGSAAGQLAQSGVEPDGMVEDLDYERWMEVDIGKIVLGNQVPQLFSTPGEVGHVFEGDDVFSILPVLPRGARIRVDFEREWRIGNRRKESSDVPVRVEILSLPAAVAVRSAAKKSA